MAGPARWLDYALFGPFDRYIRAVEKAVSDDCSSLLDIGCGDASPISRFANRPPSSVGVDAYEPAIAKSRALGIHDSYVCLNVLEIKDNFVERSFDCVMALEVIEHLEKEDALRLIVMMERIARKRVVISTPNGFLPQGAFDENLLQRHRSGWEVDEMRSMGYRVLGLSGWKPLRGAQAKPALRPYFLCDRLARLTEPFFEQRPKSAFQILCVKDID